MPIAAGLHFLFNDGGGHDKPAVVLLHGAGGDHLSWPPEIRRLPGHRVYALDLPGHGKTAGPGCQSAEAYARSIITFLDEAGLSCAVFMGHSLGGALALTLALDHSERVAGIGLISTGARLPVSAAVLDNCSSPSTFPVAVKLLVEACLDPQTPAALKEIVSKQLAAVRHTLLYNDLLASDRFDVSGRLKDILVPTLIICGTEDKITPLRSSETLARSIPGAALQTVDGAGHLLALEQPRPPGQAALDIPDDDLPPARRLTLL